jgi:alkylhydroperoxidase family enzyme
MDDPTPRIPQITGDDWPQEVREVFQVLPGPPSGWSASTTNHVLRTFAQYPELTKPFLAFNRHLLYSTSLPIRLRQIAILRTAWVRRAVYMWSSHLRLSLSLGLVGEDFAAVKQGATSDHWSPLERDIVRAADQLCARSRLDDATWAALSKHLDQKQMMDLLFTVGCYTLLSMAFNSMRVQREPELKALADEYGGNELVPDLP